MSKSRKKSSPAENLPLIKGRVVRSSGSRCWVEASDGQTYMCAIRGKFRIQGLKSTNPVAVGDWVHFSPPEENSELGLVQKILPRNNYILRRAVSHIHKVHILCANIDQALLLFTLKHPLTSFGFADRFLLVTELYHIPAKVVINKTDLIATTEERAALDSVSQLYDSLGYEVIQVSALDPLYRPQVEELLTDKVSFIGGHSGSGKSTLINLLDPNLNIKTAEISDFSQKGQHTTTYTQMHALQHGGYIIDSPGIKELGITQLTQQELSHYFPEMRQRLEGCRFRNCTHVNEPDCAVKEALEAGEIGLTRYQSYLSILEDLPRAEVS